MIRLRLATSDGFQEITPATLHRCGFTDGCEHASYVDGPADADPYYHCDLYDQRTDGKRLPPFAARLAALDDLVRRGLGSLPEAQRLLAEVGSIVGPDDAVLARLRLRAAVQGVPRG